MAILVILILAILWAAVLIPPILRSRHSSGSPSGVGDFMARLGAFGRSQHAVHDLPPLDPIMGPVGSPYTGNGFMPNSHGTVPNGNGGVPSGPVRVGAMSPAQRRRRDILVGLLAAAAVTFLMALFAGSVIFWALHLVVDGLLGGYIFLLLRHKQHRAERQVKVRPIHPPMRGVAVPAYSEVHVEQPRDAQILVLRKTGSSSY